MSTLAPPPPAPVAGPASRPGAARRRPPGRPAPARGRVVRRGAAELALCGVTVAAAWGLGRVFAGNSFLAPLLLAALISHTLAWSARRLGLGPAAAATLSGAGLVLTLAWVLEPHTLTYGLPLGSTWAAVSRDLAEAWERFGVVRAPAEPVRGFLLAAVAATWVTAFLADSFAFRFQARLEATLPSFVLFVFGAMLGADRHRVALTAFYLGAVLIFTVISGARLSRPAAWLGGRAGDGDVALVQRGLAVTLFVVVAAAVIGPHLPGADSDPLLNWRTGKKKQGSSRVTVSPLVDIRSRLIQPTGVEVFTVRSDAPSYWRLTSLERFDGIIWRSLGSYRPAGEKLPSELTPGARVELVNQQFRIGALSSIWLPAAFQPERLQGPSGVRYDRDSSSLLTEEATSDGLEYTVASALRRPTAEELAAAPVDVPGDVAGRYLALPEGFPIRVRNLARQIAGTSDSPYAMARALQDWFRSEFVYDLNVPAGHDQAAMERFLFDIRRGYCEQFAGSFAAMARSLRLPARVAVGFTPGQAEGDGVYRVTDANAHAWPEVYIAGYGWMAFEPTPNRSVPGGESYTGVEVPTAGPDPVPTTAPGAVAPPAPAPSPPGAAATPVDASGDTGGPGSGDNGRLIAAGVVVLAAGLYAGCVPFGLRVLRSRRRAAAVAPEDRVLLAWEEAQEDLALAGLPRRRSETPTEYAERAALDRDVLVAPDAAIALGVLATDSSAAAFAPAGAPDQAARRAEEAAHTIHTSVRERAKPWQRLTWALDPRPLKAFWARNRGL